MLSRRNAIMSEPAWPRGRGDPAQAAFSIGPRFPEPFDTLPELPTGPQLIEALPAVVNLALYQGDDFTLRIDVMDSTGMPYDLGDAVPKSQIRVTPASPDIAGVFECSIEEGSVLLLHLTPQVSSALPLNTVWDVQISRYDGARVTTLAAGAIMLTAEVTR